METIRAKHIRFISFIIILLLSVSLSIPLAGCDQKTGVNLYFAKYEDNQTFLKSEVRSVFKDDNFYRSIVQELIKGPESEQLYPVLPSNTDVYSVVLKDSVAVVDFSREIITSFEEIPHSSTTEMLAIYSIVNTLTEFEEIEKVRITVEGKQKGQINGLFIEDFWGHVGIYEDFARNEEIMKKGTVE